MSSKVKEIVNELATMHREYKQERYESDRDSLMTLVDEEVLQSKLEISFDHQESKVFTVRLEATCIKFWEGNCDEISIKLTSDVIVEKCKDQSKFVILYVDILGHPRQVTIQDRDSRELQMWYYSVKSNCISNPSVPKSPKTPRSPVSPGFRLPLRKASLGNFNFSRQAPVDHRNFHAIDRHAQHSSDRLHPSSIERNVQRSW